MVWLRYDFNFLFKSKADLKIWKWIDPFDIQVMANCDKNLNRGRWLIKTILLVRDRDESVL